MEAKRLIGKPLQPARPARHLSSHTSVPLVSATAFSFQDQFSSSSSVCLCNEIGWMCKSNGMQVLNETLVRPSEQHKPEVPKERITYSRDFLLKLSEVSLAQKKPEFLPDHPVVLEKAKNCLLPIAGGDRSV
ncbi:uncharacterized protein C8orf88 homolog isoform X2 [Heteronotia binoei]|uniref:uncharacterized protein C8orf88 homolog isoform X2 n=1 Tax=Heteronotia binoei TaxID=13085 RepID=UPI00292D4772|nr:uncharacterized protein C8orf88 homolog isoform X2 [Heteronotia binoei]XP_060099508.1 uncharacterized protein C8orf88 homolog isoform X2 [Heteronotia binoei]